MVGGVNSIACALGWFAALASWTAAATASDWRTSITPDGESAWKEVWTGAEAGRSGWSIHAGATYSLFAPILTDGWRVRTVGGYGQYSYHRSQRSGDGLTTARIEGQSAFTDLLVGYHVSVSPLVLKAFAGLTAEGHWLTPDDPDNSVVGSKLGAKGQLEAWLDLPAAAFLSLDLGYAQPNGSASGRMRLGQRMGPHWSTGLEAGARANIEHETAFAGLFARYQWPTGEVGGSIGTASDRDHEPTVYGTLSVMIRY